MRRTLRLALVLAFLFITGTVTSQDKAESADVPAVEKLAGKYSYAGNEKKDEAMIEAQINAAVASMSGLIRGTARKKLEGANHLVKSLEISSKGDVVTVVLDKWVVDAPSDGSKRAVTTPAGESAQVSFHLASASLIQEIDQKRGTRKNTFRLTKSGTLVMTVLETGSKLPKPVTYDLNYSAAKK